MIKLKKKMIVFISCLTFLLTGCSENSNEVDSENEKIKEIQQYYDDGNYIQALDEKIKYGLDEELGDYAGKIELMGNLSELENQESKCYICVLYFVGHYNEFKENNLIEIAYPIVIKEAQEVANQDLDIAVQFERTMEDKEISKKLEPMISIDKETMLDVMDKISNDIDYDLASDKYKESLSEKRSEYNAENPLQITDDSIYYSNGYYHCKGTLKNVGTGSYTYIKIKVIYYDNENNILTTDWVYAVDSVELKPGENKQFEIITQIDGNVNSYEFEIIR